MILKSLEVDNFKLLQIENLEFSDGVTLIRGYNESGKSTIMEAILFALYGEALRPSRRAKHRLLIENSSNRARVALNFIISDIEYRISREIFDIKGKSSNAEIWEVLPSGELHLKGKTWNEVNRIVVALLSGVTYDEIVSSCIVAQKELGKLIDQQPGKRGEIINVFLNLNDFNDTQKLMGERKKEILGPRGKGGLLENEKTLLSNLTDKLVEFDDKKSKKDNKEQEQTQTKEAFDTAQKEHKDTRRIRDTLTEYNDVATKERELKDKIEGYETQLGIYKEQLVHIEETKGKIKSEQQKLSELDYLSDIEALISDLKETSKLAETYQSQANDKNQQKETIASRIEKLNEERDELKPNVDEEEILSAKLPDMKILKILAVPMFVLLIIGLIINNLIIIPAGLIAVYILIQVIRSNNMKVQKANIQGKNNQYMGLGVLLQEKQSELENMDADILQVSKELEDSIGTISTIISNIPTQITSEIEPEKLIESSTQIIQFYDKKCNERNRITDSVGLMSEQIEREPEILEKISRIGNDSSAETAKLSKLEFPKLPKELIFSEELVSEYNKRTEDLSSQVTTLQSEVSHLEGELKELDEFLLENQDIPEQHESQKTCVQAYKRELDIVSLVMEAISETSKYLRDRVRPSVEAHMQRILPLITAERYNAVQLSENYDVSVFDPSAGEFRQREIFSGGTEDQFLLAARISFALALLPQGKDTHPEFLFLDEPLGSSDEIRREGIMNLTKTVLGETFRQIFIISHVPGLEEWADHVIELDNGQVVS